MHGVGTRLLILAGALCSTACNGVMFGIIKCGVRTPLDQEYSRA